MPTGNVPFEPHVPHTVDELGLELDPEPRRWRLLAAVAVIAAIVAGWALFLRPDGGTHLADLAPTDCYSPAVGDVTAAIHRRGCDGPHGAEFIGLFTPTATGGAYPGAEELALFGEAACRVSAADAAGLSVDQLSVRRIVLRIAVPDEQAWGSGHHDVACSFATAGNTDLDAPIAG